jgi:hypothetical protein
MSQYRIAIVRADQGPVYLRPGSVGERDLMEAIANAAVARGVGLFRTETQVRAAIVEGTRDVLRALKSEVLPQ